MAKKIRGILLTDNSNIISTLCEAHGRAQRWTISSGDLARIVKQVDRRLTVMGIPLSRRTGVEILVKTAGPKFRAYKYAVRGSVVHLRMFRDGWRLMSVQRIRRFPGQKEKLDLYVTNEAAEIAHHKLSMRYLLKPAA